MLHHNTPSDSGSHCDESHASDRLAPDVVEQIAEAIRTVLERELRDVVLGRSPSAESPLDTKQTCQRLNISPRKLDELVALGELRPLRVGRKRLFPQEQLTAFLRRCAR